MLAWDRWQIISNALQIALDGLQIRESILECVLRLVRACNLVLRAVRDDGASRDVGALTGIPYRRSLHEADGLCEVGLVREEITDCVRLARHVFVAGNWHAIPLQDVDERPVDDVKRRSGRLRRSQVG